MDFDDRYKFINKRKFKGLLQIPDDAWLEHKRKEREKNDTKNGLL